ncbi:glycosyltransferase [Kribbella sp. NPDC051587]|uniref:glycosyltransferase n=1 Tax=Kribbella sp. NPDC051587 TaxID=3364119 RepID=UPI0037919007
MIRAAGIVVPAHNEEHLIAGCLQALRIAMEPVAVPVQVCVVADRCTDATAELAKDELPGVVVLHNVVRRPLGQVRDLGMQYLLRAFGNYPRDQVWLLGTDADTRVRPDWIQRQLDHAQRGVDAVTGLVDLEPAQHLTADVRSAYQALVAARTRPADHDHIHGASFGVRASAYAGVGGYRALDTGEDRDLWFRLEAAGYVMLQPRDLDVLTSSRLRGRAHGGLADLLTAMCTPGVPVAVGIDQEEPHAPET